MYQNPRLGRIFFFFLITLNEAELVGLAVSVYVESLGNRPAKSLSKNSMVLILGANPRQTQRTPSLFTNKPTVKRLNHVVEITRI